LNPATRFLNFFVYSNLFIAACTVLMVNQTSKYLLKQLPDRSLLLFVFFSTICSYSFHWFLTSESKVQLPRITWVKKNKAVHLVLFVIGLVGAAFYFFELIEWWRWLVLAAIITFLYSAPKIPHRWFRALRKVAIGKTISLALVWTYVTAILPVIVEESRWTTDVILYAISRFFFIYAICILFDFRDREDDQAAGIRSMVTWFSEKNVNRLFYASVFICYCTVIALHFYGYSWQGIILLLIPAVITQLMYRYAKNNFSDMLYYFILDGLMMLSALLMLIFGFG